MMMEEDVVRIVETRPIEGDGLVIVEGFPDIGLVGAIAASFMADKLGMEEVGYIDSDALPPLVAVRNGRILNLIRIYRKENLLALISDVPIPPPLVKPISQKIMEWVEGKRPRLFITLTGIPEPGRLNIERPKVFVLGSRPELTEEAAKIDNVDRFTDGFVVGVKGMLLMEGYKRGLDTLLILAQSHFNYPDPGSAAEIVKYLAKYLNIEIDVKPLLESAEELKLRLRDLMMRTNQAMQGIQKAKELELPPVYL